MTDSMRTRVRLLRALDGERAARLLSFLLPVLMGLLSLRLGQDDNWDLKNYHLYNPFAFLNGKIGLDLAPAQWQSYFNPTLDLLYYGMTRVLPGPVAGFIMGVLHGLNFLLVLRIARAALPAIPGRTAVLLALAGMGGAAFLAQIGNSMGDNLTSLFVLGALLLVLDGWDTLAGGGRAALLRAVLAGLVMGLGCGLKLTNATYAVALCLGLLVVPGNTVLRLNRALLFGVGVLAGIAVSAGHWFVLMAQTFGNPLFPQFNNIFHAALAAPVGVGDTGWLPKNLAEKLLWPFVFGLDARRVGELPLRLWIWPVAYLGMLALALRAPFVHAGTRRPDSPALRQRLLLVFCAVAYLVWMNLFSIYRYLVPVELLLPLIVYLLVTGLLPARRAGGVAALLIGVLVVSGLPRASWGHAKWAREAFSATVPPFAAPRHSMVFTVHGDPPMGWLVTRFPAELAFVSLGSGFPDSPDYVARARQMALARTGPLYVMLQADRDDRSAPATFDRQQKAAADQAIVLAKAAQVLGQYGYLVDPASCRSYPALIGRTRWDYQLCSVTVDVHQG